MLGAIGALATAMQAVPSPILSDTGLGAQGTVDPNYTLVDPSGQLPLIQYPSGILEGQTTSAPLIGPGGFWVANPLPAQWDSPWVPDTSTDPWVTDNQNYNYIFQTVAGASGIASGYWGVDDTAEMIVGGTVVGDTVVGGTVVSTAATFFELTPFSVSLDQGEAVDFVVYNRVQQFNNPAGLLVDVGGPPAGCPDGGMTAGLLGGALVGLQALRRKLFR